jgi:predicted molibdopterin-dependent oxidoreductase YjgC
MSNFFGLPLLIRLLVCLDLERTKAALLKSPFTIYQDAYYPTETSAYAHLLLPAGQMGRKNGNNDQF